MAKYLTLGVNYGVWRFNTTFLTLGTVANVFYVKILRFFDLIFIRPSHSKAGQIPYDIIEVFNQKYFEKQRCLFKPATCSYF